MSPFRALLVRCPLTLVSVLLVAAMFVVPGSAAAAVPTYAAQNFAGCGGERGNGQRDAAGNLYLPCQMDTNIGRASIRIYAADGTLTRSIAAPAVAGNAYYNDVAPSRDGVYLYVSSQSHNYHRLVRQGDAYVLDGAFRFEDFQYGAARKKPMGEFLATDLDGNVYIANGTWVAEALGAPMTVIKYDPQGRVITRFGDWDSSYNKGSFYWMLTDLAVSPDGLQVYTTEVGNNRVQRWQKAFAGDDYTAQEVFGNTAADFPAVDDPRTDYDDRRGTLCTAGKFGAPYASALDPAGNLYVVQTNCHGANGMTAQVQRLENGVWTIIQGPKFRDAFAHGFSIDARGSIYIPSTNTLFRVTGVVTPPADTTIPMLTGAALPATVNTRAVTIAITATDNVAVTHVRTANDGDNIANAAWKPYAAQLAHELTAGDGAKAVKVQVRDAAGNLSAIVEARTAYTAPVVQPPVDATAPQLASATLPATVNARAVTIAVAATDNVAVTQIRAANEGQDINAAAWKPFVPQLAHDLSAGDGAKAVTVQVRDAAGNVSGTLVARTALATEVVVPPVANQAPVLAAITFPATVVGNGVTVAIDATDDREVTEMRLTSESGDWPVANDGWQPFNARATFQLTRGTGLRGVFVQVRDAQGLMSEVRYRTVTVLAGEAPQPQPQPDTAAPTFRTATVAATTATRNVILQLDAVDNVGVTQVRIANDGDDLAAAAWKPYAPQVAHELKAGNGVKTIRLQARDAAGNVSAVATVQTTLTIAPPVVTPPAPALNTAPVLRSVVVPATTTSQTVTVNLDAIDDHAVTQMRLTDENGNWPQLNDGWQAFAASTQFTLTQGVGMRGIFIQVRDAQGLQSAVVYRLLERVTGPAVDPAPVPANAAPRLASATLPASTTTTRVSVAIVATDDQKVTQMRFATDNKVWGPWVAYATTADAVLSPGAGAKHLFVQVRDAHNAESGVIDATTQFVGAPGDAPAPPPVVTPPAVDLAPRVQSITLPAVTATQLVTVRIAATDDKAITSMRLANEDGNWKAWRTYAPTLQWQLNPGRLVKGVYVQVRDAAGHESNIMFTTTLCAPCHAPAKTLKGRTASAKASLRLGAVKGSQRADRVRPSRLAQDFDYSQRDGKRDLIDCGRGFDTVLKQPEDITRNCERVVSIKVPRR